MSSVIRVERGGSGSYNEDPVIIIVAGEQIIYQNHQKRIKRREEITEVENNPRSSSSRSFPNLWDSVFPPNFYISVDPYLYDLPGFDKHSRNFLGLIWSI